VRHCTYILRDVKGTVKGTVLKNLIAAPNSLSLFGYLDAPLSDVVDQAVYRCLLRQPSRQGDVFRYQIQDLNNEVWKYSNFSPLDTSTAAYYRSFCRKREEVPPSDGHLESSAVPRSTCSWSRGIWICETWTFQDVGSNNCARRCYIGTSWNYDPDQVQMWRRLSMQKHEVQLQPQQIAVHSVL